MEGFCQPAGFLFPQTASKIGCFQAPARGSSPAWRLNSALSGIGQRRQDVRGNFPMQALGKSTIFSQVCGKRKPTGLAESSHAQDGHRRTAGQPGWEGDGGPDGGMRGEGAGIRRLSRSVRFLKGKERKDREKNACKSFRKTVC